MEYGHGDLARLALGNTWPRHELSVSLHVKADCTLDACGYLQHSLGVAEVTLWRVVMLTEQELPWGIPGLSMNSQFPYGQADCTPGASGHL
jgi:hypothetical protein